MTSTITSKGQITIPLAIRKRLNLKVGDQLEFDESAPVLVARRVINRSAWDSAVSDWQNNAGQMLKDHPWAEAGTAEIINDLRGGEADTATRPA